MDMFMLVRCLGLFFVVFLLVFLFHLFLWKVARLTGGGVRCWVSSYECGFLSQRIVEDYFSYTYFVLLVFFVVFDLEVSLLLNLPLQGLLYKNLSFYLFFLCLMGFGFGVEVAKGYVV
jgi:NADH:ubiquinone oxidoreductase subunit 3 (subunit A)